MTEIDARASSESRHGTGLCFAARLISVAVSAGMACILASWAASYGVNEGMGGIVPFHFGLSVIPFLAHSSRACCDRLEISPSWWCADAALLANAFPHHVVHHSSE